jgi:hypothetical protein
MLGLVLLFYIIGKSYIARPIEIVKWQDFMGDFYLGNGLGVNWLLSIKPDQSFFLQTYTDLGATRTYSGSVVITNSQIVLNTSENKFPMPQTLIPVQWGQRRYLIRIDDLASFCESRRDGLEPRQGGWGSVYLRVNDWDLPAEGQPITLNGNSPC